MRSNFLICVHYSEYDLMSNYVTQPSNAGAVNLLPSSPNSCIENGDSAHTGENYVILIFGDNTN